MPDLLEVKGLTASYGATQVLFDIDFRLAQGEITAILGANGAGKTTTLRAICQAVKTGGNVMFDGQQLVGKSTESVVRLVPPLIVSAAEVDAMVAILAPLIRDFLAANRAPA